MKIIFHPGGVLEFPEGIPSGLLLRAYSQDPKDPKRFVSKYPLCVLREDRCGLSPCKARAIFLWKCTHFKRAVSLEDCNACTVETQRRHGLTVE